jgi:hypothetical protein
MWKDQRTFKTLSYVTSSSTKVARLRTNLSYDPSHTDKQRMAELHTKLSLWVFGYVCRRKEKVHACWCLTQLVAHVVYRHRAESSFPLAFVFSCSVHSTERSITRLQPYKENIYESFKFIWKQAPCSELALRFRQGSLSTVLWQGVICGQGN